MQPFNMKKFFDNVKIDRNMTTKELIDTVGISRPFFYNIRNGDTGASEETYKLFCDKLSLSLKERIDFKILLIGHSKCIRDPLPECANDLEIIALLSDLNHTISDSAKLSIIDILEGEEKHRDA